MAVGQAISMIDSQSRVTGGIDYQATRMVAYLVRSNYQPPLMSGQSTLPATLAQEAVAKVEVDRTR